MCIWNIYIFFHTYEAEHIVAPALEEFSRALLAMGQEPAEQGCGAALCGEGQVTLGLGLLFSQARSCGITGNDLTLAGLFLPAGH